MYIFIKLLSLLPLPILYGISWLLYLLLFYVLGIRKKLSLQNIQSAFIQYSESECLALAKDHYKCACMVIIEIIKSFSLSKAQIKQRVVFKNLEVVEKYLEKDQSVIVVTAHHSNPEWALLACAQHINYPVDVIHRTQRVTWIHKLFYKLRFSFGITSLAMENCIAETIKRSKITRVLAMAADQSPKKNDDPYWANFLGRDTAFHTGTEKIAKAFKYPVIFMSMNRIRKGYYEASLKLITEPPYSKRHNDIMHLYVQKLEKLVTENPKDWLWAYRRWKLEKSVYN